MARFTYDFARVAVRLSGGAAAGWRVVVVGDYAVRDYDVFFLFDFDETHVLGRCEAVSLEDWVLVCDRDVIRGTINVGRDEGSMRVR